MHKNTVQVYAFIYPKGYIFCILSIRFQIISFQVTSNREIGADAISYAANAIKAAFVNCTLWARRGWRVIAYFHLQTRDYFYETA